MLDNKLSRFIISMFDRTNEHRTFSTSAEMAYFLILSIFPLIGLIISIVSLTFLTPARVVILLEQVLSQNAFESINEEIIRGVTEVSTVPLISFAMIGTIFSASGGIFAFIRSLNRAYEIDETRHYIKIWMIAMIETVIITGIMILALFVMVFGEVFQNYISNHYSSLQALGQIWKSLRYLLIQFFIFIIFSLLYYVSPNIKVKYKNVLPGALLVTFGWVLISWGFSIYVNNFKNFSKAYGSLGAGMLLLVWLYWNSTLILIGGELNAYFFQISGQKKVLKRPIKDGLDFKKRGVFFRLKQHTNKRLR